MKPTEKGVGRQAWPWMRRPGRAGVSMRSRRAKRADGGGPGNSGGVSGGVAPWARSKAAKLARRAASAALRVSPPPPLGPRGRAKSSERGPGPWLLLLPPPPLPPPPPAAGPVRSAAAAEGRPARPPVELAVVACCTHATALARSRVPAGCVSVVNGGGKWGARETSVGDKRATRQQNVRHANIQKLRQSLPAKQAAEAGQWHACVCSFIEG